MSASSPSRTRSIESTSAQWEDGRLQLETLRMHCLKERAQASLAAAGYGADPVE
jgi:hypothetical protein